MTYFYILYYSSESCIWEKIEIIRGHEIYVMPFLKPSDDHINAQTKVMSGLVILCTDWCRYQWN